MVVSVLCSMNLLFTCGYVKLRAGKDTIVVKRYEKKLTWSAARYVCRSEGGDLVKMDTRQKHDAIQKRLSRRSDAFKKLYLWIGLSDENKDNTYKWTDGTATVFTKWYRGEPSRRYQGKDEDCGSIIREFTGGMSWSDMNCERKNGFICQTK